MTRTMHSMCMATPDEFVFRRKAAEHQVDVRTLKRAWSGQTIHGAAVRERVQRALAELQATYSTATTSAPAPSAA